MDWKNEKPTETGRYFYKDKKENSHYNIWSCIVMSRNGILEAHGSGYRKVSEMPGFWYGPVQLPGEDWADWLPII